MDTNNPLRTLSVISLFCEDFIASKEFYTTVFDAKVVFEDAESCSVQFNNLLFNLLDAKCAGELVPKVAERHAGNRLQLTVWVKDLDAALKTLQDKGVTLLSGPEVKPWGMRTVTFEDPAGHNWEVAQKV
jgi:catechol 2,3-dioxygenase-like lactoylglutathione lyase family enzyme